MRLRLSLSLVVAVGSLSFVLACPAGNGVPSEDGGFAPCDAGFNGDGTAVTVDAGDCPQAEAVPAEGEGEGPDRPTDALNCQALREKSCGAAEECRDDPGCVAADLTARFEPENCLVSLGNNETFPPCTGGACDRLVAKVCGATCTDAPSCTPALTLQSRADDGDTSAEASCGTALSDEALFPPCP